MKKSIQILLAACLMLGFSFKSFADAGASARNKCRNGKRYKAKAKVNGPNSCHREVYKDKNCSSADSEAALYRQGENNCTCIGSDANPFSPQGAYAHGHADASSVYSISFKTSACNGYRAGGEPFFDNESKSRFNGNVKSDIRFTNIKYDYINNRIGLSELQALLEINSEDYLNEFSIFQLNVSIITEDANGNDITNNIFFTQVAFEDGVLKISGTPNGFSLSDFKMVPLQYGKSYSFDTPQKMIQLSSDIDESMVIEVSINTDAGNVVVGDSEIKQKSLFLSNSHNVDNQSIVLSITSLENFSGDVEIFDTNGVAIYTLNNITGVKGARKDIELPYSIFKKHGKYFLIKLRSNNGQMVTSNIKFI